MLQIILLLKATKINNHNLLISNKNGEYKNLIVDKRRKLSN